ncbi:hypothetical protein E1A91_A08G236700v1 [Gossypium mustelinum]|uniref:Uncharacterized protein n=1 Tax=Gossypium mustelinum TaxID=34275 RepID=A0A5D2YD18_GOSMU|nr:hypothetical protein E1A91_A08G236700v1 [Gossypium mustelinum]
MAMLAGKNMAKRGNFLEAFLFNPPYVSPPIERIKNKKVRHGLRFAGTLIKAGIAFAAAVSDNHNNSNGIQDSSFAAISGWIPCLFVNHLDPICSEYIGYFKHRKKLEDIGAGGLARLTSQHSLGNMAMSAVGIKDMISAHELHQWWRPDLNLNCSVYKYK